MKKIIIIVVLCVLPPLRLAAFMSNRAGQNAEELAQKVQDAASRTIYNAKRSLKIRANATAASLKTSVSEHLKTGMDHVSSMLDNTTSGATTVTTTPKDSSSSTRRSGMTPGYPSFDLMAVASDIKAAKERVVGVFTN